MTDTSRLPLPPPPPPFGAGGLSAMPVTQVSASPATPAAVPQRSANQPTLAEIVRQAYEHDYSDVHLGVGEVPRFRDRGEIVQTTYPVTDTATFNAWLREVLTEAQVREFEQGLDFDGATQYDFARVRINIFGSLRGPSMVMRLIPLRILSLDELSLPPVFRDICYYPKGLVLVTGPTGSGKSTTLAAMIDFINQEMAKNIITIEDPIEFVHQSQRSLIKQREVGVHTRQFEAALRASLREDPDIILVGELRDRETINTALKAAQTGHLVMATLHTNSAVKTIERVLNMFEPAEQPPVRVALAESLVSVIAQGLCRTIHGKRTAYHEILINTDAIKDYIIRGELEEVEQLIPKCTFDGMCTSNQSLFRLFNEGKISEETALAQSGKPNEMSQMLRGRV
ncbi:type IV pilus twitching motility protein PilT [Synechococcus elongatus]|uniref:Twitching motility protein n=2 Tax=Synechococcus elongatus TaxID=32046 RepID=Q31KP0_SYNE7|nr:type IV pilus twitching motility protein PilT [Synechococcus elongatus]ABB58379.1 twitching motility protein [Synechococcus elongatus PCC 7942 = FACHB-805]AJD57157.1 twitching motility protein PilT [Synechococcus elongatus UTEX 2973]MBD2587101.1 type IV pilus twitching motility protein PilT [Synechococcus elongatus FACHB-242]MBD2688172.1 type IV pilus twitching motility protein PilT [Synechococcus elongatus FACHB-1061]MBD2706117.1 type IV pilus twitching motility protein PilT [Synechococcus